RHLRPGPRAGAPAPRREGRRGSETVFHRDARRGREDDSGRQDARTDSKGIRPAAGVRALQTARAAEEFSEAISQPAGRTRVVADQEAGAGFLRRPSLTVNQSTWVS